MNETKVELMPPSYEGWAKVYVQSERGIPEAWRNGFYDELTHTDEEYRKSLEQAIRVHGVRWLD